MATRLRDWARIDAGLPDAAALPVAVLVAVLWTDAVNRLVKDRQDAIYGALCGVHAGLLGFVLAALTIVLGYSQSERFAVVRESGHFPTLFHAYLAGVRTHALALLLCIGGLLVDRAGHSGAICMTLVLVVSVLALLRLVRVLWVTELVVSVIVQPADRAPGATSAG